MQFAHFFADTPNLGDLGAAAGIKTLIRTKKSDALFQDINIDSKPINFLERLKLNRKCNGLILGGGGLLYNLPKKASGFYFNVSLKNYRKLNFPKCFYAIGINAEHTPHERWKFTSSFKERVSAFADLTESIGVRDIDSLNFMHSIGAKHAELTPCPSQFLLSSLSSSKTNTIALNMTSRGVSEEDLKLLSKSVKAYFDRLGLHAVLVAHHPIEDQKCIKVAQNQNIPVFIPSSPENLMEFYKQQQFVVGMRGHALLFATGARVPMLAISYNVKCDAHMKLLDQENLLLNQKDIRNIDLLHNKLENLTTNHTEISLHIEKKRSEFLQMNINFIENWLKHFS